MSRTFTTTRHIEFLISEALRPEPDPVDRMHDHLSLRLAVRHYEVYYERLLAELAESHED